MVEVLVSLEAIVLIALTILVIRLLGEVDAIRDMLNRQVNDAEDIREETHNRTPAPPMEQGNMPDARPQSPPPSRPSSQTFEATRQTQTAEIVHPPVSKSLSTGGPRPPWGAFDRHPRATKSTPKPQSIAPKRAPSLVEKSRQSQANGGFERIVGGRVLGILAALLVFFGLVLLAALIAPILTDEIRCAAMFMLSCALTGVGLLVARRGRNAFSQTLLGCGIGSIFASILLSHTLFGLIDQLPTIILMLAWMAACTLLARQQHSPLLFVVVQLGMVISTCFAYSKGLNPQSIPTLLLYQLLTTGIVVTGCMRSLERGRMSGAFSAIGVSILTSIQILVSSHHLTAANLAPFAMMTSTQYLLIACLALVVCGDTRRDGGRTDSSIMAEHLSAEICWMIALCLNVFVASMRVIGSSGVSNPGTWATLLSLALVAAHWIVRLTLGRAGRLDSQLVFASSHICAALCAILLLWRSANMHPMGATFLSAAAVAMSASGVIIRDKRLYETAVVYLGLDAMFMAFYGYASLNAFFGAPVSILYVALLDVLLALWWRMLPGERKDSSRGATLLCGIVVTELSIAPALDYLGSQFAVVAACAFATSIVLALVLSNLSARLRLSPGMAATYLAIELVVVAASCALVALPGPRAFLDGTPALSVLAIFTTIVTLSVAVAQIAKLMSRRSDAPAWQQVMAGVMLTAVLACTVSGIALANMLFAATLAAMFASFCCILCGFVRKLGALRLYGLVTTLLCVLKIVTLDFGGADPIGRVVAFILGGVACFAISALYTYALHRITDGD